jgi:DNA ligase (NAD+)
MLEMSKKEFDSLVARAKEAAEAYYHSGEMLITDAEYDEMVEAIEVAAKQNPDWDTQGLLDSVAAGTVSNSNYTVVKHEFPMLSLDKSKTIEDIDAFLERVNTSVTYEVKLDGLAVSALYENGNLTRLATRGDGESGEDITSKAPLIVGLPETINVLRKVELRGEVYMSDEDFAQTNEARVASGASLFLNPRNATAGIIRSLELDYEPRLSFACYDLAGSVTNEEFGAYKESLEWLDENGIPSAFSLTPSYSESDSPKTILDTIEAARGSLAFPIDGAVIKVNDATRRQDLGTVGKAPKWATAYKYAADTSTTILRDIEVALGRTGQMSLRAVLEPVHVAGTTITYATLHNPKFIADADIRIGDTVYVYRAGDVVPRVDKVDVTKRPDDSEPWQAPDRCVNCGSPWNKSTQLWRCDNPDCSFVYKVIYALSRSALDIDGASDAIAEALVEQGLVTSVPDIFTLTSEQLNSLELDGGRVVGEKVGAKIYQEIQNARTLPNYKFLVSLGFRTLGRTLSKRIMAKYPTLDEVAGLGFTDLVAIDGIGEEKAEIIASELANNQHLLQVYITQGLGVEKPEISEDTNESGDKPLEGEIVVVSGTVSGHTRDSAKELVETLGGTSASSVSSRTTLLVAGAGAGSKVEKAESLGIKVWSPEQLLSLS